jgi:hypothetical protein
MTFLLAESRGDTGHHKVDIGSTCIPVCVHILWSPPLLIKPPVLNQGASKPMIVPHPNHPPKPGIEIQFLPSLNLTVGVKFQCMSPWGHINSQITVTSWVQNLSRSQQIQGTISAYAR